MGLKWVAAATAAIASLATTTTASADVPQVDWVKALVDLDHIARGSSERPAPVATTRQQPGRLAPTTDDPSPQNMGNAWFGVAPRVTLVARDWASSTRLAGDRLGFVEEVRLATSTRMVVGRLRLNGPRFTPFLPAGLGQWRVDRNYVPLLPRTIEIATQLGAGFEMRLARRWQLAAETSVTTLFLDGQNHTLPQTMLWSTLVASRLEF